MDSKLVDTPINPNVKLLPNQGEPFSNLERYCRLVGKLNYLTITQPNISFVTSAAGQFLNSPCDVHGEWWSKLLDTSKKILEKVYCIKIEGTLRLLATLR